VHRPATLGNDGTEGERAFAFASADRPFRDFVENMRDGAAMLSEAGLVVYANRRLADLLDRPMQETIGSPIARFVAEADWPALEAVIESPGLVGSVEIELVTGKGARVPVLVGISPLDPEGDGHKCLTFTDITGQKAQEHEIGRLGLAQNERVEELQQAHEALAHQATHDALTGLPNRVLLVDRIDQALTRSLRTGKVTGVLFIDLDRFKQVNDTHGHTAGDAVLRRVAERLKGAVRPMDTIARVGGDEFVVLTPDLSGYMDAVDLGTRLVTELARPLDTQGGSGGLTASVGVSVVAAGNASAESMLHEADTAMYHAKSLGRNRAELFDAALGLQAHERAAEKRSLQLALDERRIVVYYQPIIELPTGDVAGFEALARIAERDGTILLPASFIGVAEESGLIVQLGELVLSAACREARGWPESGLADRPLTIAVNLSPGQVERGDLTTLVRDTLAATDLDAESLHLEITETALMELRREVLEQLVRIRDLGVQIGLDDFGTGYASLTYLRRLPVSFVKIDRSFVSGLGMDREDERIVAAVIGLARDLGLRSIAEGVETPEQLAQLRGLGCDQAQGYLFARPLPAIDLPRAFSQAAELVPR
jgi:diguanylate cyclase (GGDEF)-like protein/PAS domain S-box-containing protein